MVRVIKFEPKGEVDSYRTTAARILLLLKAGRRVNCRGGIVALSFGGNSALFVGRNGGNGQCTDVPWKFPKHLPMLNSKSSKGFSVGYLPVIVVIALQLT